MVRSCSEVLLRKESLRGDESQTGGHALHDAGRVGKAASAGCGREPPQGKGEVICQERLGGLLSFYRRPPEGADE